jgi:hypothetical protein
VFRRLPCVASTPMPGSVCCVGHVFECDTGTQPHLEVSWGPLKTDLELPVIYGLVRESGGDVYDFQMVISRESSCRGRYSAGRSEARQLRLLEGGNRATTASDLWKSK